LFDLVWERAIAITHPRTVQRRVRELLDRLGAGTRFQAGLQAVRRGWL
jgi:DNA-binding NarL/FixJ family response regulator